MFRAGQRWWWWFAYHRCSANSRAENKVQINAIVSLILTREWETFPRELGCAEKSFQFFIFFLIISISQERTVPFQFPRVRFWRISAGEIDSYEEEKKHGEKKNSIISFCVFFFCVSLAAQRGRCRCREGESQAAVNWELWKIFARFSHAKEIHGERRLSENYWN